MVRDRLAAALASSLARLLASTEGRAATVVCTSSPVGRNHCTADTSAGVALAKSTGEGVCLLGNTWGYDDTGIWVSNGCGGEFVLGQTEPEGATTQAGTTEPAAPKQKKGSPPGVETWGEFDTGDGFLVGRTAAGELDISAYALVPYINQMPGEQKFTDHLGNEHTVDGRNDIFPHRVMVFFKGWVGSPKFVYNIFLWTVNTTDQKNIFAQTAFCALPKKLELYAATSQIYGDGDKGFRNSSEYLVGLNFYPWNTRNHRLNLQLMDVNHSPASSTFGYYVGGQDGTTVTTAFSVFF